MGNLIFDPPIVAIDFDGVICEEKFPFIGRPKPYVVSSIRKIRKAGWRTILWTCRTGRYLKDAKNFLDRWNIKMDAYNDNSAITEEEWYNLGFSDTRKIGADIVIDDRSIFWKDEKDIWRIITAKLLKIYNEEG